MPLPAAERGIFRHFIDSMGYILEEEWKRAAQLGTAVGGCRHEHCPGALRALPISGTHDKKWIGAQCDAPAHHEVWAIDGLVLPRSSAHSHMPYGALDRRTETQRKMRDLAKGGVS